MKNLKSKLGENQLYPFHSWGMKITKADGIYFYDDRGNKYADLTSSASVVNIGYNNSKVKEIIKKQINKLIFSPPWCRTDEADELAEKLLNYLPKYLDTILRVNTGSESVEVALKLARKYTKKEKFMSFEHSYHGHTMAAMAIGMHGGTKKDYLPLITSDIIPHPYIKGGKDNLEKECSETLRIIEERFVTGKYAAFITESLATSAGNHLLTKEFLQSLRELCSKYSVLLIYDEVLTGFGRTGKMFSFEHFNILPDIICLAKGLGCGYATIGATITNNKIANGFDYFSTFAWNPLACAVSSKVLDIYKEKKLVKNAEVLGKYAINKLNKDLNNIKLVKDIRGLGLRIAIEISDKVSFDKIRETCLKNSVFTGASDLPCILSIAPPLIISKKEMDKCLDIIIDAIKN